MGQGRSNWSWMNDLTGRIQSIVEQAIKDQLNKSDSSYADQRRDRLSEVIGDYLSDGTMSAKDIYNEIVSEVQSY